MAAQPTNERLPWYSSFYWRIAISFVVFVVVVLVAQSIMFSYMMARSGSALSFRSPNTLATIIAMEAAAALTGNPQTDLDAYLKDNYASVPLGTYIVMKDGRVAANHATDLPESIKEDTLALLAGADPRDTPRTGRVSGPVVSAPIQVANELRGMVVLPPPPRPDGMLRDVGRLLSLPGTQVLMAVTTLAAVVIFAPARRRLRGLEGAAARLGGGDLGARAPESGRDEIARVARAFNRMAAELAARDEALRMSNQLRRQMLADVSHELKTPLTTMRGYLDTLDMPEVHLDLTTRGRYLDIVQRETRRLERIVADLLDLARYENGVATFEMRVFAIERVFTHVAERHEREARARNIDIRIEVASAVDQLVGDPGRIEQVIDNLVANALRHTSDGGLIALRASESNGDCRLSVVDSGHGIPPEHLPYVFDRFYKIDAARAADNGGDSGLGLSIAKAIVERQGGTIGVTSRPGLTEFTIVLPRQSTSTNL